MSEISDLFMSTRMEEIGEGDGDFMKCNHKMDLNNAYRIVEELEDWKERQQKQFRSILANKERKHITFLGEEWDKRRNALQSQLEESIDKCDVLASQLQNAHQEAIAAEMASRQTEHKLVTAMDEVERLYEAKLMSLKEASRRVEGDLNHKVKLMEIDKSLLEERLGVLKREKVELTEKYEHGEKEIKEVRKSSLKKDQIRSLIKQLRSCEDKLNIVVQSKEYFKDEWAKAARMVHHYKAEHQQSITNRIKMYKTQIDNTAGGDLSGVLKQLKQRIMNVQFDDDLTEPLMTHRSQPNLSQRRSNTRSRSVSYNKYGMDTGRYSNDGNDMHFTVPHDVNYLGSRCDSEIFSSESSEETGSASHKYSTSDLFTFPNSNFSRHPIHNHTLSDNAFLTVSQRQFSVKQKNYFSDNDIPQ